MKSIAVFLAAAAALHVNLAAAQAAGEASSAAKKELVARVLKLQQSGIENLGRTLAEQPAAQLAPAVQAALARLPQDKREGVARQIEADVRRYAEEAVPIVRDKAVALAPGVLGPMIDQRFTEEELRQLATMLESPVFARFQSLGGEMQRALGQKVVGETRAAVEPKVKALEQNIQNRLRAAGFSVPGGPGPGPGPGPAAPGPRASGAAGN